MHSTIRTRATALFASFVLSLVALAAAVHAPAQQAGCTPAERNAALHRLEREVVESVPREITSLADAVKPDGRLAGWMLAHGHVVLAGSGAVVLSNNAARMPAPQLLMYAPSPASAPADWLDFDGPDGPYRLIGWGYFAPYLPGDEPPPFPCISAREWVVHEAGWHLMDGGMRLTPGAATEPPRPADGTPIFFWHPRVWDLHLWIQHDGPATVAYWNPAAPAGGLALPAGAAFTVEGGRPRPLPPPR